MTIQIGLRAQDISEHSLEHLFAVTKNYGFNNVQFDPFQFLPASLIKSTDAYSPGLLTMIADKFREAGISISVLGNYVNIIDYDRRTQWENLQTFADSLAAAKYLHAGVVGTETGSVLSPFGYSRDNYTTEALNRVITAVKGMAKDAERLGSILAIEPGINHPMNNNYAVRQVLDEVNSPNLFVIFDLANLLSADNQHNQDEILANADRLYGNRICTFHLSDIQFVNGQRENVPFGTGIVDVERYINFINKVKPFTYAILEGTKEQDLDKAVRMVRKYDHDFGLK